MVQISDNGIGMDEKDINSVFEGFVDLSSNNRTGGLGIYFAKNLIEQHKGSISVYSELGKGTTYKLIFPLIKSKQKSKIIKKV